MLGLSLLAHLDALQAGALSLLALGLSLLAHLDVLQAGTSSLQALGLSLLALLDALQAGASSLLTTSMTDKPSPSRYLKNQERLRKSNVIPSI